MNLTSFTGGGKESRLKGPGEDLPKLEKNRFTIKRKESVSKGKGSRYVTKPTEGARASISRRLSEKKYGPVGVGRRTWVGKEVTGKGKVPGVLGQVVGGNRPIQNRKNLDRKRESTHKRRGGRRELP